MNGALLPCSHVTQSIADWLLGHFHMSVYLCPDYRPVSRPDGRFNDPHCQHHRNYIINQKYRPSHITGDRRLKGGKSWYNKFRGSLGGLPWADKAVCCGFNPFDTPYRCLGRKRWIWFLSFLQEKLAFYGILALMEVYNGMTSQHMPQCRQTKYTSVFVGSIWGKDTLVLWKRN